MATLPDLPQAEAAIVELTNAYRKENAQGEVRPNAQLTAAARAYATFLARSSLFSHTADGREPSQRAAAAGYTYCQVAENLALNLDSRGFATQQLARQVVDGWINSPGHRKNLIAPHVTEIGVAVARAPDNDPKFISVQLFGRPQALMYKFQIANGSQTKVAYTFGGRDHEIEPRYTITHTACEPGPVTFFESRTGSSAKTLAARYEARSEQVFTLKSVAGGGVIVEVKTK